MAGDCFTLRFATASVAAYKATKDLELSAPDFDCTHFSLTKYTYIRLQ